MSDDNFEGWAYEIDWFADHTWVNCPGKGKFVCWGGSDGPDNRRIVSGMGNNYEVADCYRRPDFGHDDTAGIIYGVNGVCHQTANLFMYPARTVLNFDVRGYWASCLAYGVYGTLSVPAGPGVFFLSWLATVYNPCYQQNKGAEMARESEQTGGDALFSKIQALYQQTLMMSTGTAHDIAVRELAILTQHADPDANPSAFEDLHREFLVARDSILASGVRGDVLAEQINELVIKYQRAISDRIGPKALSRITGQEPGDFRKVVDPAIAAKAAKHGSE